MMKELLNTLAAGDVDLADYKVIRMDISYSYSKVYKQLGLAFKESWQDDNLMLGTANDFLISIAKYILKEKNSKIKLFEFFSIIFFFFHILLF